jgi:predicted MPP superfamily phosphohydrolase
VEAPIERLPAEFDGYTIGVLADLHQAPLPGLKHTRRAAEMVRRAEPDLIALLGDYGVSFKYSYAASRPFYRYAFWALAPVIRSLSPPDGIVGVLGNHDYYYNGPAVADWLTSLGVRALVNDHHLVERGGKRLAVGGVDDASKRQVDPQGGCAGVPADVPRVILSHNPDGILHLASDWRPALVLSGHTHGGQVILPLIGALVRNSVVCGSRSTRGWVPNDRAPLFVSAGVGSQVPLRFRCPPEVAIVRLRSRNSGLGQGTRDKGQEGGPA